MHRYPHFHDRGRQPYRAHHRHSPPPGNPALTHEEEFELRYKLVEKALKAFETPVDDQTIFD